MATTGIIQVTPEMLRSEAKNVRRIKSNHDNEMSQLYKIVSALEKPTFQKFSQMLEEYAALMDLSANEMETKDADLASRIAKSATFN